MNTNDPHVQEQLRQKDERDAQQIQWAIKKLKAIEDAGVATMPHCEGSYRHEAVQRRIDNAVKIYCAEFLKK